MYTSPSPLPRRAPLRLPFSVHIRTLFFLFLSLFSGAPRRTHLVGAGVPDGPHRFSFMPTVGIFRAPMDAPRRGRRPRRPASFLFHASGGAIPHPDGRTRRGRRPRRPASFFFHASGGAIPHPDGRTRRGRRPRRPASFLFHASGGDISRSGATSFCPRRQKDAKTPPKTDGFWISFHPIAAAPQKGPHRIAPAPIPAAAPMHHTAVLCSPNIKNRRPSGPHIHLPPAAASARFDNRPNGRPAHPPRRMRERQR